MKGLYNTLAHLFTWMKRCGTHKTLVVSAKGQDQMGHLQLKNNNKNKLVFSEIDCNEALYSQSDSIVTRSILSVLC